MSVCYIYDQYRVNICMYLITESVYLILESIHLHPPTHTHTHTHTYIYIYNWFFSQYAWIQAYIHIHYISRWSIIPWSVIKLGRISLDVEITEIWIITINVIKLPKHWWGHTQTNTHTHTHTTLYRNPSLATSECTILAGIKNVKTNIFFQFLSPSVHHVFR